VKTLVVVLALAGCGSARKTIAFGAGAIVAGSVGLELAKGTEEPLTTPLVAHALPTLALGILMLSGGVAVAMRDRPVGY
jgi:dihydroorotate dehydrogenase